MIANERHTASEKKTKMHSLFVIAECVSVHFLGAKSTEINISIFIVICGLVKLQVNFAFYFTV